MDHEAQLEAAATAAAPPKEQRGKEQHKGNDDARTTTASTSTSSSSSSSLPRGGTAVIVGGGVAGTAAAAELCSRRPDARVTLVARDDKLKVATNVVRHTKYIETFDISPVDAAAFAPPNLTIVRGEALSVDLEKKELTVKRVAAAAASAEETATTTSNADNEEEKGSSSSSLEKKLPFDVLIAATGAVPKRLLPPSREDQKESERIVYLRDADSVSSAAASLRSARRVVVAGNGGIALGLAHALGSSDVVACDPACVPAKEEGAGGDLMQRERRQRRRRRSRRKVLWAAKHGHVGDAFFDADAAAFLARAIGKSRRRKKKEEEEEEETKQGGGAARVAPAPPLPTSLVPPRPTTAAAAAAAAPSSSSPSSTTTSSSSSSLAFGAAVGPGWVEALTCAIGRDGGGGGGDDEEENEGEEEEEMEGEEGGGIELHLNATVTSVEEKKNDNNNTEGEEEDPEPQPPFPLVVKLSDGSAPFACDAVVAAVGVAPDTSWLPRSLERSARDGGVLVDGRMRSSLGASLLACGDACSVRRGCHGDRWFQMRLWSQARATGAAAGRSAAAAATGGGGKGQGEGGGGGDKGDDDGGEESPWPHSLELFAHATSVAGLRVVLLGLYNGQGLEGEPEEDIVTYCREDEGSREGGDDESGGGTFVRVLLLRGRLAGAVLIGDTGLEGTFEDLILDGIDVSFLGPRLLDPELDIEAIFD